MQVCKYFCHPSFPYNPVTFMIGNYEPGVLPGWLLHSIKEDAVAHFDNVHEIPSDLWIIEWFEIYQQFTVIDEIIPKIAYCQCSRLILKNQVLDIDDFITLTISSQVQFLHFSSTFVKTKNNHPVPFEKFLETLPKVKEIKL